MRILRPCVSGCVVSFQITVLKVLQGIRKTRVDCHLTRYVSILISSGTDWTNRTKTLGRAAPKLDIFRIRLCYGNVNVGIYKGGGQFLVWSKHHFRSLPSLCQHELI